MKTLIFTALVVLAGGYLLLEQQTTWLDSVLPKQNIARTADNIKQQIDVKFDELSEKYQRDQKQNIKQLEQRVEQLELALEKHKAKLVVTTETVSAPQTQPIVEDTFTPLPKVQELSLSTEPNNPKPKSNVVRQVNLQDITTRMQNLSLQAANEYH